MLECYCKDCKKELSASASACPKCGCAQPAGGWPKNTIAHQLGEAFWLPVRLAFTAMFAVAILYGLYRIVALL